VGRRVVEKNGARQAAGRKHVATNADGIQDER